MSIAMNSPRKVHVTPHEISLADLFLVIGVNQQDIINASKIHYTKRLTPKILDSYPKEVSTTQYPYINNINMICFNDEYNPLKTEEGSANKSALKYFTITLYNGERKYAASLVFYEFDSNIIKKPLKSKERLIPFALCVISSTPNYEMHNNFLIKLYQLFIQRITAPEKNIAEKYSIEFYISMLFHHLSINSELKTEVEINFTKGKTSQFAKFCNIKEGPFVVSNFTLKYLFMKVSKENIAHLLNIITLERKLILVSENYGDISQMIEPLLSMISPLEYVFTNISYISKSMIDYVDSPQPFVMGMSRNTWEYYMRVNSITSELNVLDVDKGTFIIKESIPLFPSSEKSNLLKHFSLALIEQKNAIDSKNKYTPNEKDSKIHDSWLTATIQIKKAMLNFFLKLLKNYHEFYYESPKDSTTAASIYNFDKYMKQFKGEHYAFMKEFTNTQCFTTFIEKSKKVISNPSDKSCIYWFIHYLKLKSDTLIKEEENRAISKITSCLQAPFVYKIEDIYAVYEKYLSPQNARKIDNDRTFYIQHKNISKMPKICYYRYKKNITINKRPLQQIFTDLSLPITKNRRTEINAVIPFKTRQLDLSKMSNPKCSRNELSQKMRSLHNKENNQSINNITDDEDIACELNAHEISIAESLVSRSICKSKLVSPSPKHKFHINSSNNVDWLRFRSLTTIFEIAKKKSNDDTPPIRVSDKLECRKLLEMSTSASLVEKKKKVLIEEQMKWNVNK